MDRIENSGYFYPNKFARIYLIALEQILGENGLEEILQAAHLGILMSSFPSIDLEKEFDFSSMAMIHSALDEAYGPRGGRSITQRAGGLFFTGLKDFGALAGVSNSNFTEQSLSARLKVVIPTIARIFSKFSDQLCTVQDSGDIFLFHNHRCPACWGRMSDGRMMCYSFVGMLKEALRWLGGGREFRVEEITCKARGEECCTFRIQKEPLH